MNQEPDIGKLNIYHRTGRYFILLYLIVMFLFIGLFTSAMELNSFGSFVFAACNTITYPALYLAPCAALVFLSIYLLGLSGLKERTRNLVVFIEGSLLSGLLILALMVDYKIFSMFKFHINGFVLNLIFTPGGIESMGATGTDYVLAVILALTCFVVSGGIIYFSDFLSGKFSISRRKELVCVILFVAAITVSAVIDKFQYAYDCYKNNTTTFYDAQKIPLYITTSMTKIFKSMKIAAGKRSDIVLKSNKSSLCYPLKPIKLVKPEKMYNLVFLVAESWRGDTVTPDIMPATTKFADKSIVFHNHYSSGNGTRMAMFGMFYGLYGSYWDAFLADRRPPVLISAMKKLGYQFSLHTSAKFTYPEFDKTIFSCISRKDMEQSAGSGGFVNDRENVGHILDFIEKRDKTKPFMTFMFFESPHAPYTFPDDCVVKKDYLPTFNYSTVNIKENIDGIKKRYLNSVHHLDTQLDRIFKFLEREKLMDNTIVVVSGDHGEEFMEKGHWGHNESFHQEQIRPPLMIYIPGKKHQDINRLSSHLDIPAMLAPYFGITNPPEDYCLGYDLLDGGNRTFTACSSWNKLCYIDEKIKFVLSLLPFPTETGTDDHILTQNESEAFDKTKVLTMMKDAKLFFAK